MWSPPSSSRRQPHAELSPARPTPPPHPPLHPDALQHPRQILRRCEHTIEHRADPGPVTAHAWRRPNRRRRSCGRDGCCSSSSRTSRTSPEPGKSSEQVVPGDTKLVADDERTLKGKRAPDGWHRPSAVLDPLCGERQEAGQLVPRGGPRAAVRKPAEQLGLGHGAITRGQAGQHGLEPVGEGLERVGAEGGRGIQVLHSSSVIQPDEPPARAPEGGPWRIRPDSPFAGGCLKRGAQAQSSHGPVTPPTAVISPYR